MVSFQRWGPRQVLGRLLGIVQRLPTEAAEFVQAVAEVRALRAWEYFDEGIIPWSEAIEVPAIALQQSGVQIAVQGLNAGNVVVLVDQIGNTSSQVLIVALNAGVFGAIPSAGAPRFDDARQGPASLGIGPQNVQITRGQVGTVDGEVARIWPTTPHLQHKRWLLTNVLGAYALGFPSVTIAGAAANTAVSVSVSGLVIPLR